MSHFLFATWDGGGNVDVALGIAQELVGRGHAVTVLAPESQRPRVTAAGADFLAFGGQMPGLKDVPGYFFTTLGAPERARELEQAAAEVAADFAVLDCNLFSCLQGDLRVPVAVLITTPGGLFLSPCRVLVEQLNVGLRSSGMPELADPAVAWRSGDLVLIASWAEFDRRDPALTEAVYTGPVRAPQTAGGWSPPSETVRGPLVVVSYSTVSLLNSPARLQTALDALADLPVDVIASCSDRYSPGDLHPPANARVHARLNHREVMAQADVVICHAGHGTTAEAIAAGVPVVCVPGLGLDQAALAARVQELGLGIALAESAMPMQIREAAECILEDPTYRSRAAAFRDRVGPIAGAQNAAGLLESAIIGLPV